MECLYDMPTGFWRVFGKPANVRVQSPGPESPTTVPARPACPRWADRKLSPMSQGRTWIVSTYFEIHQRRHTAPSDACVKPLDAARDHDRQR